MWSYVLADLHVHTVLSPCAEIEMIPPLIVRRALELGLGLIAVTDHNAALNAAAVIEAAAGSGVTVLPGMEVHTREEVHLVCLFDRVEQALSWQERVFAALPDIENDEEAFGAQYVVDATGEYLCTEMRTLSVATSLTVEQAVEGVRALGGIVLAAHVDRPWCSLIGVLGFVPPGLPIAGLELSWRADPAAWASKTAGARAYGHGLLVSGDAHSPEQMIARTMFKVKALTVHELAMALAGREGRWVKIDNRS